MYLDIFDVHPLVALINLLPDIDPLYAGEKLQENGRDVPKTVQHILDEEENGRRYRRLDALPNLKRKREVDEPKKPNCAALAAKERFTSEEHRAKHKAINYLTMSTTVLSQEFPLLTVLCVKRVFGENSQCLFPTYMALHALYRTLDLNAPHKDVKKTKTKVDSRFSPENLQQTIASEADADKKAALEELLGARDVIELERAEEEEAKRLQELEEANLREATSTGAMGVCGCCFDDIPLNRMVHCDGDEMHYFCRSCARRNVETVIGLSKYEFSCMSTDACEAGFSMEQRLLFLDKKTLKKLERLEREANLRQAGIENLASCPFCDFAAEYPPVEVNKVFTCENPECGVVSCRLCKEEAHIPKTCEEMKKEDNGEEARKTIEEAMSSAMIRKCNKCSAPFIKEAGCNKMTCTRCMNVQCYICHKSCDYTHFNDPSRGGKEGNCALFDDVKKRHNDEVTAAEERTRRELIEKNPEMAKILLKNGEGSKDAAAAAPAAPAAAAQPAAPAGGARNIFGRPFARAPRANANQQHPLNAPAQAGAGAAAAPNGGPAPPPVAGAADAAVQGPNNPAAQPAAMAPNQRGLRAAVEPIGNQNGLGAAPAAQAVIPPVDPEPEVQILGVRPVRGGRHRGKPAPRNNIAAGRLSGGFGRLFNGLGRHQVGRQPQAVDAQARHA